jgi:hypothetical protein
MRVSATLSQNPLHRATSLLLAKFFRLGVNGMARSGNTMRSTSVVAPTHPESLRTIPRQRVNSNLFLCRRLLETAFADATHTRNGQPTPEARDALTWIQTDCDWSTSGLNPPAELRVGYYGSFEWCCGWLGLNPREVREHGIPFPVCSRSAHEWHRIKRRQVNVRNGVRYIAGLPDIYRRWHTS